MIRKRPRKRNRRERAEDEDSGFPGIPYDSEPEITPWLVPTGIPNVYQTPAEPVDPTDCDRWPDSPYCGGMGLSQTRLELAVDISVNPCEVCFTFTPTLFFVGLPPYTICIRRDIPECRKPPTDPDFGLIPDPEDFPQEIQGQLYNNKCANGETFELCIYAGIKSTDTKTFIEVNEYWQRWHSSEGQTERGERLGSLYAFKQTYKRAMAKPNAAVYGLGSEYDSFVQNMYDDSLVHHGNGIYQGAYFIRYRGEIVGEANVIFRMKQRGFYAGVAPYELENCIIRQAYGFQILNPPCAVSAPSPTAPPYPLENPGDACCMACGESEELLRLIAKRLGTDNYPVSVPQSMLSDRGNGIKKIESLSEFLHWFILQFDSLIGEFPLQITIEDNDPTKPGDQKEKIKIPNLAEGIAEVMGVALSANINTQTLINSSIRNLIESGGAKIHALEAKSIAQSIADYLAFDAREEKTDVTMAFTPNKVQLDEILQESEQKIPLYTYSDDRDFKDEMTDLLFAAAITRAVHYRKLGGDIKGDLKARFKDLIKFGEKDPEIPTQPPTDPTQQPEPPKTDFDRFVEDVEIGFMNVPGISDSTRPYGRPFDQRPRIRELGNTSDNTDAGV